MAKIAFLLLAHQDPDRLAAKARALTAHGDCVAIHFDARAPKAAWDALRAGLKGVQGVTFARRVKCGWGEFSLVQASLNLIRAARRAFDGITHYYLISGDCYPTKSRGYFERFLDADRDHVEINDFFESGWIKTGLKEERLIYRHWFNERTARWWFYQSLEVQRRLALDRPLPEGLSIKIGSQWWVLRAATVERLLGFIARRRDVVRFFRTTWIPDETFFQTLVAHLVPHDQIERRPPTHLRFSDYGMPVVFYGDHAEYLRNRPTLFARKVSRQARDLQETLLAGFRAWDSDAPEGGSESGLYQYLAGRGRVGQRYAPRFWERPIGPRHGVTLLLILAKHWHIGAAVAAKAAEVAGLRSLGYVFDDEGDLDLGLGNLERGLAKRGRHRLALMNLVYDTLKTDRLILCLDPAQEDAAAEFAEKLGHVRMLLVDRPVSDAHILSHALRTDLLCAESGAFERGEVMGTLRHQFTSEIERLRDRFSDRIFLNALDRPREDNILDIGHFLRVARPAAEAVAREAERWRE